MILFLSSVKVISGALIFYNDFNLSEIVTNCKNTLIIHFTGTVSLMFVNSSKFVFTTRVRK